MSRVKWEWKFSAASSWLSSPARTRGWLEALAAGPLRNSSGLQRTGVAPTVIPTELEAVQAEAIGHLVQGNVSIAVVTEAGARAG